MPITIRMKDQSEYVVHGEYTLKDFRTDFLDRHDDYVELNVASGSAVIPTMLVKENIISIQDKPVRLKQARFT